MNKQFDYLIKTIEHNIPANPSIDDVFESYKITVHADEIIRRGI